MKEDKQKQIHCCVMAVSILLLVTLMAEVITWSIKRRNDMNPTSRQLMVTVSNKGLEICDNKDGSNCTVPFTKYADYLVDQEVEMQDKNDMSEDNQSCSDYTRPSLKVYGPSDCDKTVNGNGNKVMWLRDPSEEKPAIDNENPVYDNGDIEIKKTGYYYVSVILRVNTTLLKARNVTQVTHKLYRYSSKQRMVTVVLETIKSFCKGDGGDLLTSDVGSGFELDAGDRLFVETRHCEDLDMKPQGNVFALYMA